MFLLYWYFSTFFLSWSSPKHFANFPSNQHRSALQICNVDGRREFCALNSALPQSQEGCLLTSICAQGSWFIRALSTEWIGYLWIHRSFSSYFQMQFSPDPYPFFLFSKLLLPGILRGRWLCASYLRLLSSQILGWPDNLGDSCGSELLLTSKGLFCFLGIAVVQRHPSHAFLFLSSTQGSLDEGQGGILRLNFFLWYFTPLQQCRTAEAGVQNCPTCIN